MALNEQHVTSPKGSSWGVSTIYGSPAKGTGILNNELYRGRYIWNRSKWVKNPDTGIRARIERPQTEWQVMDLPEIRIVTDLQWSRVKARQSKSKLSGGSAGRGGAPQQHLLSGILRCGECGGPMIAINQHRYGCANRANRGNCDMTHTVNREMAENRIMDYIKQDLLAPEAINYLKSEVRQLMKSEREQENKNTASRKSLQRELENISEAIATLGFSEPIQRRYQKTQAALDTLNVKPVNLNLYPS